MLEYHSCLIFLGIIYNWGQIGVKTLWISGSNELLTKKNHRICLKYGGFYGCGGRTRTYDLRVMSPTSFQLLYSAIFCCALLSACV